MLLIYYKICDIIWNEYNENRNFKKCIKHVTNVLKQYEFFKFWQDDLNMTYFEKQRGSNEKCPKHEFFQLQCGSNDNDPKHKHNYLHCNNNYQSPKHKSFIDI
jgi:hypothetical protein